LGFPEVLRPLVLELFQVLEPTLILLQQQQQQVILIVQVILQFQILAVVVQTQIYHLITDYFLL
jgi:hypothetical protein